MWQALVGFAASLFVVGMLFGNDETPGVASEKNTAAPAIEAKQETPRTNAEPIRSRNARRQGGGGEWTGHRGKVTRATLENGVLKLTLDGEEYEVAIGDRTHAMVRTIEKDGNDVVVGVYLSNADGRRGAAGARPARKSKVD